MSHLRVLTLSLSLLAVTALTPAFASDNAGSRPSTTTAHVGINGAVAEPIGAVPPPLPVGSANSVPVGSANAVPVGVPAGSVPVGATPSVTTPGTTAVGTTSPSTFNATNTTSTNHTTGAYVSPNTPTGTMSPSGTYMSGPTPTGTSAPTLNPNMKP